MAMRFGADLGGTKIAAVVLDDAGAERWASRIPTPQLNDFIQELRAMRQAPSRDRRRLNLLYGTQTGTRPPRFRFFVNDPGIVTRDYGYWVENQMRERFELEGVPVSIDFVRRS